MGRRRMGWAQRGGRWNRRLERMETIRMDMLHAVAVREYAYQDTKNAQVATDVVVVGGDGDGKAEAKPVEAKKASEFCAELLRVAYASMDDTASGVWDKFVRRYPRFPCIRMRLWATSTKDIAHREVGTWMHQCQYYRPITPADALRRGCADAIETFLEAHKRMVVNVVTNSVYQTYTEKFVHYWNTFVIKLDVLLRLRSTLTVVGNLARFKHALEDLYTMACMDIVIRRGEIVTCVVRMGQLRLDTGARPDLPVPHIADIRADSMYKIVLLFHYPDAVLTRVL